MPRSESPRELIWCACQVIATPLSTVGVGLTRMLCSFRLAHGISVGIPRDEGQADERFAKVERALTLIGDLAPRRLERVRSDLSEILVGPGRRASLWVRSRTCVLPDSQVDRRSVSHVALMIVHEAAHARLARAGVRDRLERRHRVEILCVGEEIEFASRLPQDRFPSRDVVIAELRECQAKLNAKVPPRGAPHN